MTKDEFRDLAALLLVLLGVVPAYQGRTDTAELLVLLAIFLELAGRRGQG